jgi:hypothetical protein
MHSFILIYSSHCTSCFSLSSAFYSSRFPFEFFYFIISLYSAYLGFSCICLYHLLIFLHPTVCLIVCVITETPKGALCFSWVRQENEWIFLHVPFSYLSRRLPPPPQYHELKLIMFRLHTHIKMIFHISVAHDFSLWRLSGFGSLLLPILWRCVHHFSIHSCIISSVEEINYVIPYMYFLCKITHVT